MSNIGRERGEETPPSSKVTMLQLQRRVRRRRKKWWLFKPVATYPHSSPPQNWALLSRFQNVWRKKRTREMMCYGTTVEPRLANFLMCCSEFATTSKLYLLWYYFKELVHIGIDPSIPTKIFLLLLLLLLPFLQWSPSGGNFQLAGGANCLSLSL